jgi:hypothetical protein
MIERKRERGTISDAMGILGIDKARTIEAMAARGIIPSAAKIGRRWTFNLAALRTFVKDQEREAWQRSERHPRAVIGSGMSSTGARGSRASWNGSHSEQIIRRWRSGAGKHGTKV